jgi:hypothetical protein
MVSASGVESTEMAATLAKPRWSTGRAQMTLRQPAVVIRWAQIAQRLPVSGGTELRAQSIQVAEAP